MIRSFEVPNGWSSEIDHAECFLIKKRSPRLLLVSYSRMRDVRPNSVSGYPLHIFVRGKQSIVTFEQKLKKGLQEQHYLSPESKRRNYGAFMVYAPMYEQMDQYTIPSIVKNYEVWMQDDSVMSTPFEEVEQYL